ncbi:MAG: hypothetical protein ACJ75J_14325 [Cytophagaceae bacterium]
MKKIIVLFLLCYSANSMAQDYQLGSGVLLYRFNGNYTDRNSYLYSIDQTSVVFNLMFSGYFPLKQIKEEFYLGINPNAGMGFLNNTFSGDLPIYATLRYGSGSSSESLKDVGVAFGAGGRFSAFSTYLINATSNYSSFFVSPSIMAQVSFTPASNGKFSLRADFTPLPVNKDNGKFVGQITQYNFLLMRTF